VRQLLEHGAHTRAQPGERAAVYPLAIATENLALVLENPNIRNPYTGATEAPAGSEAIIRILLESGADADARVSQSDDLTPLGSLTEALSRMSPPLLARLSPSAQSVIGVET
jgi:hypothetical protein